MKANEKLYCIISKDRHRDDIVYLFTGTEEGVNKKCEEIWKRFFNNRKSDEGRTFYALDGDYELRVIMPSII